MTYPGPTSARAVVRNETASSAPAQVELFGVAIHDVTRDEALDIIGARIRSRRPGYIVTPNVDHICRLQRDAEFRRVYSGAFLSLADGVPVLWAARLLGVPIREKVSGSDMVYWLSEYCAKKGFSIFLLGAAEGVAEKAGRVLEGLYPGLRIAGTHSPPLGFEKDPAAAATALGRVRDSNADVCYVALGAPKQEFWMHANSAASGVPVMMGVGAGLDFVAGHIRRAPRILQRLGLEWLWRMCQEPRRLVRRYLIDDALFFILFARAVRDKWRRPKAP